jgi:hypothetical protein
MAVIMPPRPAPTMMTCLELGMRGKEGKNNYISHIMEESPLSADADLEARRRLQTWRPVACRPGPALPATEGRVLAPQECKMRRKYIVASGPLQVGASRKRKRGNEKRVEIGSFK